MSLGHVRMVQLVTEVTNIFSLPNTFDSLQLRSLPPREIGPLAETLAERRKSMDQKGGKCAASWEFLFYRSGLVIVCDRLRDHSKIMLHIEDGNARKNTVKIQKDVHVYCFQSLSYPIFFCDGFE